MVSKSKAFFIFAAVACLLTVWLALAIINAYDSETAQQPGAVSPPLSAAEAALAANSPPPVNALEVPVNYELLKGQETPVENEAPPHLTALEKTPASTPENKESALEISAAQNTPPRSAMGQSGSMLFEKNPGETEAPPPMDTRPATAATPPAPAKNPPASVKNPPAEPAKNPASAKKPANASGATPPPAKPKTAAPPPSRNASAKFFSVQLAAFSSADNAGKLKKDLEKAGAQAFITQATVGGRLWHRVMSGRFHSRAEAVAHETYLVKKNFIKAGEQNRIKTIESGGAQ